MTRHKTAMIAAALGFGLVATLAGQGQIIVELAANVQEDDGGGPHGGGGYTLFDPNKVDDFGIYYGAADWLRDANCPAASPCLDGIVDLNFGMTFANAYYDYPEGFDRQIKQLHEYMLAPAYAAPVSADTLISATLTLSADRVIDMTMAGCTDCPAPEWMYVNVFAGDGLLTTLADAQLDFDRCDRTDPNSWDVTFHLLSERGNRVTQDEIDYYGGLIELEIDLTEEVRALMADTLPFVGLSIAGSHDGDFTLLSLDPPGPPIVLPKLTLIAALRGDLNCDGVVTFSDINPFVLRLTNPAGYAAAYPDCPDENGDVNGDGGVGFGDINPFVDLLTGGSHGVVYGGPQSSERAGAHGQQPSATAPREFGDFNADGFVDQFDRVRFEECLASGGGVGATDCAACDLDGDKDVDEEDLAVFRSLFSK